MHAIFAKILYELEKNHDLVLVSIVSQEGSSPRGLGAQMLVGSTGRLLGTVGGGSVELLCEKFAVSLLKSKHSEERFFSLRQNAKDDIGMVCGGDITVWFQYIDATLPEWTELAAKTIARLTSHLGGWLVLNTDGTLPALLDHRVNVLYGACADSVPVLNENAYAKTENCYLLPLPVRDRVIIFGAGHCTQALAPILHKVGFRVTVMDNRSELLRKDLFPDAECLICGDFTKLSDYFDFSPSNYYVIMTNGHSHDLDVQKQVLTHESTYVGVIGSASKKAFVNQRLRDSGIPEEAIAQVHSPIGIAIKAVTPEEIAISIAGELIMVRATLRESYGIKAHGCPMH